jgi:hypothetical protein
MGVITRLPQNRPYPVSISRADDEFKSGAFSRIYLSDQMQKTSYLGMVQSFDLDPNGAMAANVKTPQDLRPFHNIQLTRHLTSGSLTPKSGCVNS